MDYEMNQLSGESAKQQHTCLIPEKGGSFK